MMLNWLYRLIHFRHRRMVVLRLTSSFNVSEAGRLIKRDPDRGGRSSSLTVGANRK
jgi:hypothetical protein